MFLGLCVKEEGEGVDLSVCVCVCVMKLVGFTHALILEDVLKWSSVGRRRLCLESTVRRRGEYVDIWLLIVSGEGWGVDGVVWLDPRLRRLCGCVIGFLPGWCR